MDPGSPLRGSDRHRGDGRSRPQRLVPRARTVSNRSGPLEQDATGGHNEPRNDGDAEARQERRRIKALERELSRKDKALAETAALLVLSKKLAAIFHDGEDA